MEKYEFKSTILLTFIHKMRKINNFLLQKIPRQNIFPRLMFIIQNFSAIFEINIVKLALFNLNLPKEMKYDAHFHKQKICPKMVENVLKVLSCSCIGAGSIWSNVTLCYSERRLNWLPFRMTPCKTTARVTEVMTLYRPFPVQRR